MFYEQFVIDFGSRFYRLNLKNNFTDIIFICVGSNNRRQFGTNSRG